LEKTLLSFASKSDLPIGNLISEIGKSFLNWPYVGHTLEKGSDEKMVINLKEFDCTTFVENCLAIARNIKSKQTGFDGFAFELQTIRYRDGIRNQYPSRLHYFSEWLLNNEAKGIIELPAETLGLPFQNKVGFMSSHPESYQCLKENPGFIPEMKKLEETISAKKYYYIPKEKIKEIEDKLEEGDIIGITTNLVGLDMVHTGILTRVNGRIHLLHASSAAKKVVISEEPLADYLAKSKIQTGIMIGRAK